MEGLSKGRGALVPISDRDQAPGFFLPMRLTIGALPIIVYPHRKALRASFTRPADGCLERYLRELYDRHPQLLEMSDYHIVVLWGESGDRMADVWKFDRVADWGSGPRADVLVYRELGREHDVGISAGDALIMLGKEEEWRRQAHDLAEYLTGSRPPLPLGLSSSEDFYLPKPEFTDRSRRIHHGPLAR